MATKVKITFAESAVKDLEEIQSWYIKQEAPNVGSRIVQEIFSQVERLALFPQSGRVVPEFGMTNLREIIHPPFRIVYRIDRTGLKIVRVWRGERLIILP